MFYKIDIKQTTTSIMTNKFEDVMLQRTDADLLKIITGPADDYQPEALKAAKQEFAKRNLSANQIETAKQEIEQDQKIRSIKANQPLETAWKILTFIFPGLIQIIFSGTFKADGFDRKARELVRWTIYGFGFYAGLIVLIFLLDAIL
ncbi:MAG: hypothetical protein LBD59_11360 [Prevotellaceae bacterium]|jgi:uncharacterized membrane protein (DUF106 family)|nr:hypothetical protein [Prevotellaceae bacterium]